MLNPLRKLVLAASFGAAIASFASGSSALPLLDAASSHSRRSRFQLCAGRARSVRWADPVLILHVEACG